MSARNTLAAKAVRRQLRAERHERGDAQQRRSVAFSVVYGLIALSECPPRQRVRHRATRGRNR